MTNTTTSSEDIAAALAAPPGLDNHTHALLCGAALTAARTWMEAHGLRLAQVELLYWYGVRQVAFDHWPEPGELEAHWDDETFECMVVASSTDGDWLRENVVGIYSRPGGTALGDLIASIGQMAALAVARRWADARPELTVRCLYGDAYQGLVEVQSRDGSWSGCVRVFIDEHRPVDVVATLEQLVSEDSQNLGPNRHFAEVLLGEPAAWVEFGGLGFLRDVED